ncbi:MAG TPA: hypothetical protein VFX61_23605 [Micromonosporaceae bacterium]|nr:hypothetical protein [Micromonosporaceae bacterium]
MRYAPPESLHGMLQRGRGRGAELALIDPAAPDLVYDCITCDYRWDWQVDERYVYLARLVRDLHLPLAPIGATLWKTDPNQGSTFHNCAGVLEALGHAGVSEAVDEVRRYIHHGPHWLDLLESVAIEWPRDWWDDLAEVADRRLTPADRQNLWWRSEPWRSWADRHAWAADLARPLPPRPPCADWPVEQLLDLVRDPHTPPERKAPALFALSRREPQPVLLDLAERLILADPPHPVPGLRRALKRLGPLAVAKARTWAQRPNHPLATTGLDILAEHGDGRDLPLMVADIDGQWGTDWCGFNTAADGIARIATRASPNERAATYRVLPKLAKLWFITPHSYERASYLRALLALRPNADDPWLSEGLWDCEADVRVLAANRAPLTENTRRRLHQLVTDPIEDDQVAETASARLSEPTEA